MKDRPDLFDAYQQKVNCAVLELPKPELCRLQLWAISLTGSKADGEDLLGRAILETFDGTRKWHCGEEGKVAIPIQAHLITSMRSIWSNWRQKKSNVNELACLDEDGASDRLPALALGSEGLVVSQLYVAAILARLGQNEQTLVSFLMAGYSFKEIAENLRVSPRTIQRRVNSIRGKVREWLGGSV